MQSEIDLSAKKETSFRKQTCAMAQPSISTKRGLKVSRIQSERGLRLANQSPVAPKPHKKGRPIFERAHLARSRYETGKWMRLTVLT